MEFLTNIPLALPHFLYHVHVLVRNFKFQISATCKKLLRFNLMENNKLHNSVDEVMVSKY